MGSLQAIAFFILLHAIILLSTVKVKCQDEPPCKEPGLACPEIVCKMMNSRKTNLCDEIHCEGVTPEDCSKSDSEYKRGLTMCGCCPGCAKYRDVGDPCDVSSPGPSPNPNCTDPFCPILMNECKLGLVCEYLGESSKVCALKGSTSPSDDQTCEGRRNMGLVGELYWTPSCEEDGSYSPKQCKGSRDDGNEGICFCTDGNGNRIFGREWWSKSENQTCACSRQVNTLRAQGNIAAIHCSYDGNYESLQCDMDAGVCYCVEPMTGKLTGAVLPEHQWRNLPCYSLNVTGGDPTGSYLKVCESEWVAGQRISKEAQLHGLHVLSARDLKCDYDGSYSPTLRINGLMYCADKLLTTAIPTSGHYQEIGLREMNCQCYRDSLLYQEEGRNFLKSCHNATGNYSPTSIVDHIPGNENYRCVDRDGMFFGDKVAKRYQCCLLGGDACAFEPEDVKKECYDPATNRGYKPCSAWAT